MSKQDLPPRPWRIRNSPPSGIYAADGSFILRLPAINVSENSKEDVEAFLRRRKAIEEAIVDVINERDLP